MPYQQHQCPEGYNGMATCAQYLGMLAHMAWATGMIVMQCAMHKLAVEEWLVRAVMAMYHRAATAVRSAYGITQHSAVQIKPVTVSYRHERNLL